MQLSQLGHTSNLIVSLYTKEVQEVVSFTCDWNGKKIEDTGRQMFPFLPPESAVRPNKQMKIIL